MSYDRTPIKNLNKGVKHAKLDSTQIVRAKKELLENHLGCPALLFVKQNRKMVPYFVILSEVDHNGQYFIAKHKCYDPNGKFRCYLSYTISISSLMSKEQILVLFDEI